MAEVFIERLSLAGVSTRTSANSLAGYRHLVLRGVARSLRAAADNSTLRLRFNGDAGNNYQSQLLYASNNSSAGVIAQAVSYAAEINIPAFLSGAGFATEFSAEINFHTLTDLQKGGVLKSADHTNGTVTGATIRVIGFQWANTAALTSITALEGNAQLFDVGSFVDIHGVE
jgi:hypothetical protein